MYDHIHRQIAQGRAADRSRAQSAPGRPRSIRDRPPPWIRRHAAAAAARAANRLDAESARRAIAS
jgi:hypothetical protein